jgi:hypothetical protein
MSCPYIPEQKQPLTAIACQTLPRLWLPSSQSPGVHCVCAKIGGNRVGNLTPVLLGFGVTPAGLTMG